MSTAMSPHAKAGSRRFWVTVFCFFIFNCVAWVVYDRSYAAMHRGTLRVSAFEPGDRAVIDRRTTLRWYFSDDVLPTTVYGKDPGKISPVVPGKWAWENPRTLTFVPSTDLPRATPVTFTLATELLRTGTGAAMKQPYVSCVNSMPLEVQGVHQSATVENDRYVLDLNFNDRVAPGDVLLHTTMTSPDGKALGCHLFGQSTGKTVRLVTDSVLLDAGDSQMMLSVKVSPGLAGFSGPLGLDQPYTTYVGLGKKLMATQLTAASPTRQKSYLTLYFNSEIDLAALKKVLTVEPAVPFSLEGWNSQAVFLRGNFVPGTRYTVHIAALPAGALSADKAKTPRPGALAAFMPDMGSDVWFDNDQGYLSTSGNRTIVAHAMNVAAVRVSVTRMYDNNLVAWRNASDGSHWSDTESFSKPIATRTIKVPGGQNVKRDIPVCLDDLLPADMQRNGVWQIAVTAADSANEDADTGYGGGETAVVTLSDIGLTAKQTRGGLVAWATSLRTASPIAGIRIRAFSSKNQLLGEAITDASGIARLADLHPAKDEVVAVLLASTSPLVATVPVMKPSAASEEATANALSQIISKFPGVTNARVELHSTFEQRIEGSTPPSATVFITTTGKDANEKQLIQAATDGVANAVSNLASNRVSVIMNGVGWPTTAPANPNEEGNPTSRPVFENQENELTWLDLRHTHWELGDSDISGAAYLRTGQSAFMFTDRGIYRPGETVHLRAILRSPGDVAPKTAFPVKWQLKRPDLRDWKNETVMLDQDGSAATDVALPDDLPAGQWTVTLGLPGDDRKNTATFGSVTFQVEDFIPNRLKVSLALQTGQEKDPRRYTISETPLDVDVQGDYLFGRPGAGLAVDVNTHAVATVFSPTGWDGWGFGDRAGIATVAKTSEASPKPTRKRSKAKHPNAQPTGDVNLVSDTEHPEVATLDEHGRYRSSLSVAEIVHVPDDFTKGDQYMGPWTLSASAGVHEAGGRAVTISRQIAVDAVPAYIGVRRVDAEGTAKPGETSEFQIKLVKPDGAPATDRDVDLSAQLLKETWNTTLVFRDGQYHYDSTRVLDTVKTDVVHIRQGVGVFVADVPVSGQFVVRLFDATTGTLTTLPFYCTDGSGWDENVDRKNPEHLDVRVLGIGESEDATDPKKTEHTSWHVGETARVLIASPFKGRLLLSVETDDVVSTQVVEMTGSHTVVPVKVTDDCWPNAYICATVIRPIDPNVKWQTHRAFGVTHLNMDSNERRLQVTLDAPAVIRPLQSLDVRVLVTDPEGNAVGNAAITLAAVDEGICSLTDFKTPDPLKFFSSRRALGVHSADVFSLLMPEVAKPDGERAVGGDKGSPDLNGRYRSPVGAHRVKPVALAWATVRSDADGIARGSFSLPQFQGRLRIMAVGYTARLLGSTDRGVTVRSPILAQSSWPRFAAPGDRFTVPVVLFNNQSSGGDATVSVEMLNDERTPRGLLKFNGGATDQPTKLSPVALTAGGQQQVNLDVAVGNAVGVAKVRLTVVMGDETFQEEVELPVRPASQRMEFGGVLSASTTQPTSFTTASNLMPGTAALHVSVTPWPTLNLPAGLDYLDRYPHGCVEQTTSTLFPLIALGDVGKQIDPTLFDPERIALRVDAGITHLIGMQTADGGLSMWPGQTEPWPWASVYAAHFLTEAKAAGYEVPADFYAHLLAYVRHLLDNGTDDAAHLETQAYASYVMALAGKPDRAILDRLTELSNAGVKPGDPSDGYAMRGDAKLMLACAWLLSGRRDLAEGLLPEVIPSPRGNRQWDGNLGSPIRDRAMLIMAMEQVQPNRAELPELVQQLADCGVRKQWGSTQDVAFSVLAIGRYLRDQQKRLPYNSARLLMGETVLAEAKAGQSIGWTAEGSQLQSLSDFHLELTGGRDAVGHLSWLENGVPMTPPKDAEHGIKIHRRYLNLDGKELASTVRTGDLVRVEIVLEAPAYQPNLVVEDLLPAGLEVENPRLETSAKDQDDAENKVPTFGNGRAQMLDDRVVITGQMSASPTARCSYLARAITPGVYTVPPVRAEAMYDLNTNAMSGSGKLTVLPVIKDMAAVQ